MSTELEPRGGEMLAGVESEWGHLIAFAAAQEGFDVEKFRMLLEQKRIEEDRERERAFRRAKSAFHAECPAIPYDKTATTPNASWKYASLGLICKIINPVLARHGLSYHWEERDGRKYCVLAHIDGHKEESSFTLSTQGQQGGLAKMTTQQQEGAADTYAKNRTLCSVCGISGEEDTDGVGAQQPSREQPSKEGTQIMADWLKHRHELEGKPRDEKLRRFGAWFLEHTDASVFTPVVTSWTPEQIEACKQQLAKEAKAREQAQP